MNCGFKMDLKGKVGNTQKHRKYKARFVAEGYSQVEGIEYEVIVSPVVRYSSIILVISLVAWMGWRIH